ncbi:transporter substrate-binding domain-containing protein [Paucibacter sp. TC2R-5]|nr:transporter substrate-binding domain-containing protein [Paucibacter sp. TC2R-5]
MQRYLIGFALCLSALNCSAGGSSVRIGVTSSIQPFTLPVQDSGLLVDLLRAAFAAESVASSFQYMPPLRLVREFELGRIDIYTSAKPNSGQPGVLSHWPVTTFGNQAITLKAKFPRLDGIEAMTKLRVVTFQNAKRFLGPEFAAMAAANKDYIEVAGHLPTAMLSLDRADVIVSQPDIFRFWLLHDKARRDKQAVLNDFAFHDLFSAGNKYWFAFRSEALRDQFERGIKEIYQNGQAEAIIDRYAVDYGSSRDFLIELDCRFKKVRPANCQAATP